MLAIMRLSDASFDEESFQGVNDNLHLMIGDSFCYSDTLKFIGTQSLDNVDALIIITC